MMASRVPHRKVSVLYGVCVCMCECVCMWSEWVWDKLFFIWKLNSILLIIKVILGTFLVGESIIQKYHSELGMKRQVEFLLSSNFHEKITSLNVRLSFWGKFLFCYLPWQYSILILLSLSFYFIFTKYQY